MNKLTPEQIEKAINWWGEVITNPKFDNGDKSSNGLLCLALASSAQDKMAPNKEKIEKFKINLRKALEMEKANDYMHFHGLHTDYDPDEILADSASKAGISDMNFPWKTHMWFRDGKVTVAYGYAAQPVEI